MQFHGFLCIIEGLKRPIYEMRPRGSKFVFELIDSSHLRLEFWENSDCSWVRNNKRRASNKRRVSFKRRG